MACNAERSTFICPFACGRFALGLIKKAHKSVQLSMGTLFIRFLIGGVVVSLFAALGDILRPKSFAGNNACCAVCTMG
jgi:hypothetical protein